MERESSNLKKAIGKGQSIVIRRARKAQNIGIMGAMECRGPNLEDMKGGRGLGREAVLVQKGIGLSQEPWRL